MSSYLKDLSIVLPNTASFIALELPLRSLTKKDIVKYFKALGVKNSAILSLKGQQ